MLSHVAAIIDSYGGLRVVVGSKRSIRANTRCDDLALLIPSLRISEPVPWQQIPWLIARVEFFARNWISTRNDPDHPRRENMVMYQLRCLEEPRSKRALHLPDICET